MRSSLSGFLVTLTAIGLCSCGPTGPKLFPVQGKVVLTDGTPIAYGHVILHPDAESGNTSQEICQGTIQDGSYTIMTGARTGAPAGKYKVCIEAAKETDANNPYVTEWLADEKYINPSRSNLKMEVVANPEPARYDFKLDPHPPQKGN